MPYVDKVASEDFSEEAAAPYFLFYANSLLFLHLSLKANHCSVFPMYVVFVCVLANCIIITSIRTVFQIPSSYICLHLLL